MVVVAGAGTVERAGLEVDQETEVGVGQGVGTGAGIVVAGVERVVAVAEVVSVCS